MTKSDAAVRIIACVTRGGMCASSATLTMPWFCLEELRHFKHVTTGGVLVMGRRTLEGLPERMQRQHERPMVALCRDPTRLPPKTLAYAASGPTDALAVAAERWPGRPAWVIGGPRTWDSFLAAGLVDSCLVSRLKEDHLTADVPWQPPPGWRLYGVVAERESFTVEEWRPPR